MVVPCSRTSQFDFNSHTQAYHVLLRLKSAQYRFVTDLANKTEWIRLAAPLVTLTSAVLLIAMAVSCVVEPLIKGLANIFGARFSESCSFTKGLLNITLGVLVGAMKAGILTFINIPIEVPVVFIGIAMDPKDFAEIVVPNEILEAVNNETLTLIRIY